MNFSAFLAGCARRGNVVTVAAGPEWLQGRTAFGGWASAIAYNVARQAGTGTLGEMPPLRSAMINFVGPIPATFDVVPRILRSGRTASWIAVDMVAEGNVVLNATFLFLQPRDSVVTVANLPPPKVTAGPGEIPREVYGENPPPFVDRFRSHPAREGRRGPPEVTQWVRYLDRGGLDGVSELLLIGDFSPPGFVHQTAERGGLCSLTWQLNLLGEVPDIGDDFWLVHTTSHHTLAGANSQLMQVWDNVGNPVAAGQQETALFF